MKITATVPPIKIGIPVLNGGEYLLKLLRSIDLPAEVVIIVNRIGQVKPCLERALTDPELRTWTHLNVVHLWIDGNLGVAGSWNRLIDHFGGDCFIANSDIEFEGGVLAEALSQTRDFPGFAMQHLHAAACFYVPATFTRQAGWFDENFYPAYGEDQEMSLRCSALSLPRRNFSGIRLGGVRHAGSQTLKDCSSLERRYISEAQKLGGAYLRRRWGALPAAGSSPEKVAPFDDLSQHASDWTLDLAVRDEIAKLHVELFGEVAPTLFYRSSGGLAPGPVQIPATVSLGHGPTSSG